MSQQSAHGRWTLSSSDDDDDAPPARFNNIKSERVDPPRQDTRKTEPATKTIASVFQSKTVKPAVKSEPSSAVKTEERPTAPVIGSEARQAAHANQQQPVKYESKPSPAAKRKREAEEGGWALSSSDDDNEDKGPGIPLSGQQPKELPKKQPSPKRVKKEEVRPPSPHGRTYYIDEPPDYFDTSISEEAESYRFYLNKVVGLDKKYNTGAVHIKGTTQPSLSTGPDGATFGF